MLPGSEDGVLALLPASQVSALVSGLRCVYMSECKYEHVCARVCVCAHLPMSMCCVHVIACLWVHACQSDLAVRLSSENQLHHWLAV